LGIEGDWDWANPKTSFCRNTDTGPACSDVGRGVLTLNSTTVWLATLRGRIGYAWDRYLVYGTGGVAMGKVNSSINANCLVGGCASSNAPQNTTGSFSNTNTGWVAGAGIEAMLTANWTARVEYLHVDLGTINNTLILPTSSAQSASWSHKVTDDIVRVGANYKFGN
jgi:outer membrane immunogenic protein